MRYELPPTLVHMAAEGRLIPFAGAGLSVGVGLPTWREMLEHAVDVVEDGPSFNEIEKSCAGNLLQAAEYLFIESGGHIGPLRQRLSEILTTSHVDVCLSSSHIELLNLGAPQIYTTNYDNLLERAHREMGVSCDVVALPRHLALGGTTSRPQVVKYHGDLRYENTLVLTERSYYERMDFESPMDLKFRSDLLGKSVLFLGYSFSDINIRMIWHRLMQMMVDVPEHDRPTSWIIKFDHDPIQDALNLASGIRTINLSIDDPDDSSSYSDRLGAFLCQLANTVSMNGFTPTVMRRQFVSTALLDAIDGGFVRKNIRLGRAAMPAEILSYVQALALREIPPSLSDRVSDTFALMSNSATLGLATQSRIIFQAAVNTLTQGFFSPGVSSTILRGLTRSVPRKVLLQVIDKYVKDFERNFPWEELLSQPQPAPFANSIARLLSSESALNQAGQHDSNILYLFDLALRLRAGQIPLKSDDPAIFGILDDAIAEARSFIESTLNHAYTPDPERPPKFEYAEKFEHRGNIDELDPFDFPEGMAE